MDFKDSLSKVAQSLSSGASSAAKKSAELYEIAKLNLSIQSEKDRIKELEEKIGHIIYKSYSDRGKDKHNGKSRPREPFEDRIIKLCKKISEINENIITLKKKIAKVKNVKVCSSCGLEIPAGSHHCPYCDDDD